MNPASPAPDDPSGGPDSNRGPGALRLGSIAGAEVRVAPSWFLVAALVAFVSEPRIEAVHPGLGGWKFVVGVGFAVLLYLAILVHEAAHAVMARRFGAQVESITLHFFGGMTAVRGESRSPRQEFWVAVVGPLASIGVGLVALALWFALPPGLMKFGAGGLAAANLLIGALNLLPAIPLDGGRVVQAIVWKRTGDRLAASILVSRLGRVLAVVVLFTPWGVALLLGFAPTFVDMALAGVLALFLWGAASRHAGQAQLLRRIDLLDARALSRRAVVVDERMPLAQAIAAAQSAEAGSIVTLDPYGRPAGIASENAVLAVPHERRPWIPVSDVSRLLAEGMTLPVELAGEELIRAIGRLPTSEYLLVHGDGAIHGVLSTADVDHAFKRLPL